jgi:hypothetical protein
MNWAIRLGMRRPVHLPGHWLFAIGKIRFCQLNLSSDILNPKLMVDSNLPMYSGEPRFLLPKDGEVILLFRNSLVIKLQDSVQVRSLSADKREECKTFPKGMDFEQQLGAAKRHIAWNPHAVQITPTFLPGDKIVETYKDAVIVDAKKDWQVILPLRGVRSACLIKEEMTEGEKVKRARSFVDWFSMTESKRQGITDPAKKVQSDLLLKDFQNRINALRQQNSQSNGMKTDL